MFRFIIFSLFVFRVWAAPQNHIKKTFLNSTEPRIINGIPATLGQFPWQAAVYVTGKDSSLWFCGGSVISSEWILTAGHCVDKALSARIKTGLISLNDNSTETISTEPVLHSGYDPTTLENDIGLFKLDEPLVFDENTKAVSLSGEILEDGVEVRVSGWGKTSDIGAISPTLNYVDLFTIPGSLCEESYGEGEIFDGMVCATSGTDALKSTCNGDSGGPVVINADTDPLHVAIVSFVGDNGCTSAPSGYTRTAYYREWIQQQTGV